MTPKEKAKELLIKFSYHICEDNGLCENESTNECAKNCALIVVDEILSNELLENQPKFNKMRGDDPLSTQTDFWMEVKLEIKLL